MKLTALTADLQHRLLQGTEDKDVKALIYFSEEAVPGSMFFAIPGAEENGLNFAETAVKQGADVVVTQEIWRPQDEAAETVTVLLVDDVRQALAHCSCRFYGHPSRELLTVGVTGTKGKTSTSWMLRDILEQAGLKTGLIGTVKNGWDGHFKEADRTTPQSADIQRWMREMADDGCMAVVMEVSSQGLMQGRVAGITFDAAVFTNLSPDHIGPGEHASFEEYAYWKSTLFRQCRRAVINEDDPRWRALLPEEGPQEVISFGQSESSDFQCENLKLTVEEGMLGTEFRLRAREEADGHPVHLRLAGRFNGMNAAGAAAAARSLGIPWPVIQRALHSVHVPGRVEPADTHGRTHVLVDYAHNGVALSQLLTDLRVYEPARLIAVFGCGGNRDRNRRFEMGRAAAQLADLTVVTSDNPRNEEPLAIIKDITDAMDAAGAAEGSYVVIPDRAEAIRWAVRQGTEDDIILIAGKGHETYQLAGGKKIHFDDREMVERAVQEAAADAAVNSGHEKQ